MNMENNGEKQILADKILGRIKRENVKMRPKIHFVLRSIFYVVSVIVAALFTLFLISFILFSLRASGVIYAPGFGFPGLRIFIGSLPWLLILSSVALIAIMEVLVKHFSFSYKKPVLYTLLGIIAVVSIGVFAVGKTPFHADLFERAREGHLPALGGVYKGYVLQKNIDVHPGVVSEITEGGFEIENPRGDTLNVITGPETEFMGDIKVGDTVIIFGARDNDSIHATSVRAVDSDLLRRLGHRRKPHR